MIENTISRDDFVRQIQLAKTGSYFNQSNPGFHKLLKISYIYRFKFRT